MYKLILAGYLCSARFGMGKKVSLKIIKAYISI